MAGRYRVWLLCALAGCAVLTGCTGLPERDEEVRRLEVELGSMPGVDDVSTIYSNDFTAGTDLVLELRVETASEDELADVAGRVNELKQDDFDGYNQATKFFVGPRATAAFGATVDPALLTERARQLRNILAHIPGTEITWSHTELDLRDAPAAAKSLAAVRHELGDAQVRVTAIPRGDTPMWTVAFPFRPSDEARIKHQLSRFGTRVNSVTVDNGTLTRMAVQVRSPASARDELDAVIDATQPTREHPLMLDWSASGPDNARREFAGSVHVAACSYPRTTGEQEPQDYYTTKAIELQRQLRARFDTCP